MSLIQRTTISYESNSRKHSFHTKRSNLELITNLLRFFICTIVVRFDYFSWKDDQLESVSCKWHKKYNTLHKGYIKYEII